MESQEQMVEESHVDQPAEPSVEPPAPTYKVKVQGEEIEVSLEELLNGYQRQADYTRKAQELAERRRQLEVAEAFTEALNRNPQAVISALAQQYGVDLYGQEQSLDTEPLDPVEAKLAELETWKREQEMAAIQAQIDKTLADLHTKHGDFDENALFEFAVRHGINDLELAFKAFNYERVREQAAKIREAENAQEDARRTDEKRQASLVAPGTRTGTAAAPAPRKLETIRDFYEEAVRSLGLQA